MKLQIGDKVKWYTGIGSQMRLTGIVMEELENGTIDVFSHTKNEIPFHMDLNIERNKLTLIY